MGPRSLLPVYNMDAVLEAKHPGWCPPVPAPACACLSAEQRISGESIQPCGKMSSQMQPTRSVSTIITLITLTSAKTHANTCYVINLGKLPAISIIKQKNGMVSTAQENTDQAGHLVPRDHVPPRGAGKVAKG